MYSGASLRVMHIELRIAIDKFLPFVLKELLFRTQFTTNAVGRDMLHES